jgi:hypothetical protein
MDGKALALWGMFLGRIFRLSHTMEAFDEGWKLSRARGTIYDATNVPIDRLLGSKEPRVVSRPGKRIVVALCSRHRALKGRAIKSMVATKMYRGIRHQATPHWIYMQRRIHCGRFSVPSTLKPAIYHYRPAAPLSILNDFQCRNLCSSVTLICISLRFLSSFPPGFRMINFK